jgi:hypothetical protein
MHIYYDQRSQKYSVFLQSWWGISHDPRHVTPVFSQTRTYMLKLFAFELAGKIFEARRKSRSTMYATVQRFLNSSKREFPFAIKFKFKFACNLRQLKSALYRTFRVRHLRQAHWESYKTKTYCWSKWQRRIYSKHSRYQKWCVCKL